MTGDVYAGDDSLKAEGGSGDHRGVFVIRLLADADPDVFLRVASHLNVLNRAPARVVLAREAEDHVRMTIVVTDCSAFIVDMFNTHIVRKRKQRKKFILFLMTTILYTRRLES